MWHAQSMRANLSIQAAARRLRKAMTPLEVRLWLRLRTDNGPRFRRQHALSPYVLDFYCPAARLAVEVDGWGHNMGDHPARRSPRRLACSAGPVRMYAACTWRAARRLLANYHAQKPAADARSRGIFPSSLQHQNMYR